MTQDSLHHTDPSLPPFPAEEAAAGESPSPQPRVWRRQAVQADTVPPDPELMMPLPPGKPLTMTPPALSGDRWQDGLLTVEKTPFAEELDSITGMKGKRLLTEQRGVAGDPLPYRFRTDNFVNAALLLSFFLVAWVTARSRHFLRKQAKDFFHERERENLFTERTQRELRGQVFLVFQTCFVLGILFFDFTQERQAEVFNQVSPYKLLGAGVGIFSLYYLLKTGLYSFVNSVFFTRTQTRRWTESYLLSILLLGGTLLPVALLVVYFDMSFPRMADCFLLVLLIDKTLLFYKCFRIFFNYHWGWAHLFLYFCALEIAPLCILFRVLVFTNNLLLTIN